VPLGLLAEAERAAFLKDVKAHTTVKHVCYRAVCVPLFGTNRVCGTRVTDPGSYPRPRPSSLSPY